MLTSDDSLPMYVDEIGAISLLTPDEERSLAKTVPVAKRSSASSWLARYLPKRRRRRRWLPAATIALVLMSL
jgi:Sigma-70 factor, region 1.2